MVAAAKPRKPRGAKKGGANGASEEPEPAFIDVPVTFGGVSIGESTCRLGVRISRENLKLAKADQCFCGHRLVGKVQLGGADEASGQGKLMDDLNHYVDGAFDCKRLGVSADTLSIGLTFSLKDVDISELAKFSKGTGRLIVQDVREIPEDEKASADPEDDEDEEEEDEDE